MRISLESPVAESMPILFDLSKQLHDHDALPFDITKVNSAFNYLIENPALGDVFLIAANESTQQTIVGFIVLSYSVSIEFGGKIAMIEQLFLSPNWRHQGVGSHIMPKIELHAKQKQCHALMLEMNIGNAYARKFYERIGYQTRRQHCLMFKSMQHQHEQIPQ